MEIKPKTLTDQRFTPSIKRIWISFAIIITAGITTFFFAKKEINDNRQRLMLVKKEINETKTKYPSRMEIIKEMREKEKQSNQ
jgi:hypothetical protein